MADWNTLSAGRWRRPSIIRQAQTWNLRVYQEHARIIPARGAPPGDTPNRTPDTASPEQAAVSLVEASNHQALRL
jgi:hypothetical protein